MTKKHKHDRFTVKARIGTVRGQMKHLKLLSEWNATASLIIVDCEADLKAFPGPLPTQPEGGKA